MDADRQALIESYIRQLKASFRGLRRPVSEASEEVLYALYAAKDWEGLLDHIRSFLRMDMKVRLELATSGKRNKPAWVVMPQPMPVYGSDEFRRLIVPVYFRTSFLETSSFEATVIVGAHEICHIVLSVLQHRLHKREKAVDLTAMILGFRDFYTTGCRSVQMVESPRLSGMSYNPFDSQTVYKETESIGYLTYEEVCYASHYMTYR